MALTAPVAEEYLAARRAAGYTAYLTPKALAPLLGYLRELGVAPEAEIAVPATQAEALLERYRRYLLAERGLREKVARGYVDSVRPFVAGYAAAGGADLRWLTAGDVTAFLTGQSRRLAPKTAQRLATALRSLLRFWHVEGLISGPLDRAVPKVANRRPGLPRPLDPAQVRALLASCDRGTAGGRRDLAMLTLLARMGLRAGRGRRAAPGRHRLAARRDHHRRQGEPPRPAPAARRRRRGSRGLAAAWPARRRPWTAACSSGSRRRTGA